MTAAWFLFTVCSIAAMAMSVAQDRANKKEWRDMSDDTQ
jgi:hypothetical protein